MLPGSVHQFARHLRHSGLIFDAEEKLESEEFVTGADHGGHVECVLEQVLELILVPPCRR